MSHFAQRQFVSRVAESFPNLFSNTTVLEVGSLDINGSVREFFTNCSYTGIDVASGPGVDIVCQGQDFDAPSNSFDVVISCEVMEHNPFWEETFRNMVRLCRPGGLVLMTCASIGRPEHGTTRTTPKASPLTIDLGWDYYRNISERMFRSKIDLAAHFAEFRTWTNWSSFDLQFLGIKGEESTDPQLRAQWLACTTRIDEYVQAANSRKVIPYRRFAALVGGDRWFTAMRSFADLLTYVHANE